MREARALDKAMEDRRVARKSSVSSVCSSSSGIGMGQAWRNKYGSGRNRTGSIASLITNGSMLSEHLVEEEEEEELLGVRGGFTETSSSSAEPTEDEASPSNVAVNSESLLSGSFLAGTPKARHYNQVHIPPRSAPPYKLSTGLSLETPAATRTSFEITPRALGKTKVRRRPPPLVGVLSPVPPSPVTPVHILPPGPVRTRTEGRRPDIPPAYMRNAHRQSRKSQAQCASAAPTQTLFVFPPSPTHNAQTPSTMTVTSNAALPFPVTTPRVATFKTEGRRRSFIGIGSLATPTTASSRVDARGWVGVR